MDYRKFSAEDFALDESFQKWVLDPNLELKKFWEQWVRDNPQKSVEITEAINLIRAAGLSKDHQANLAYLAVWKDLEKHAVQTKPKPFVRYSRIAAVLTFLS